MSGMRLFAILFRLQAARALNRLRMHRVPSRGALLGWAVIVGLSLVGMQLVMKSSLQSLLDAETMRDLLQGLTEGNGDPVRFTRYEDVPDQGARVMLVFLNCTLLSVLFLKWGHWQSLERDEEWEWFAGQPCPAWPLFVQRCLVESLWPQGFSLVIGSFFVSLGLMRDMRPLPAIGWGFIMVLILQTLVAAPRLTLDLWLRLRCRAPRVRTFRGLSGLLGAGLLVFGMQALSLDRGWTLSAVVRYGRVLDQTPAALALSAIIRMNQSAGFRHLLLLFGFVILVHGCCYIGAALILRRPVPRESRWSRQAVWRPESWRGLRKFLWYRLHPLTRRDFSLLARDRHFTLQILVAPLMLAMIPQGLPIQDASWLLAMGLGTGLLFLWSAVFHILPMEGQSLWMLYTWPQPLAHFLRRRLLLLLSLAACYTALTLGFGSLRSDAALEFEAWRLFYIAWTILCFGIIGTALAVLTYRPEAQNRDLRPGYLVNYGMLLLAVMSGWFLFRPSRLESLLAFGLLLCLAAYSWWRMIAFLPTLLDRHASIQKRLGSIL